MYWCALTVCDLSRHAHANRVLLTVCSWKHLWSANCRCSVYTLLAETHVASSFLSSLIFSPWWKRSHLCLLGAEAPALSLNRTLCAPLESRVSFLQVHKAVRFAAIAAAKQLVFVKNNQALWAQSCNFFCVKTNPMHLHISLKY